MIQAIELRYTPTSIKEYMALIPLDASPNLPFEKKSTSVSTMRGYEPYKGEVFTLNDILAGLSLTISPRDKISHFQLLAYEENVAESMLGSISINTIHSDIGIFVLTEPLEVTFEVDEDIYICWNEDLKLYGCGDSRREALCELESFFGGIYDSYRNTPKSELTEDAKQLLKKFNRRIWVEL